MSRPSLIVCCGLPGAGKSTVSGYVADRLGAIRYRTDTVRKELFPEPSYEPSETAETYEELLERARNELSDGRDVVLDATFSSREFRDRAGRMARDAGADVAFVRVTCEPAALRERIERRTQTASDAGYAEHLEVKAAFDDFERDHVVVDNSGTIDDTHRQLDRSVLSTHRAEGDAR